MAICCLISVTLKHAYLCTPCWTQTNTALPPKGNVPSQYGLWGSISPNCCYTAAPSQISATLSRYVGGASLKCALFGASCGFSSQLHQQAAWMLPNNTAEQVGTVVSGYLAEFPYIITPSAFLPLCYLQLYYDVPAGPSCRRCLPLSAQSAWC